MKRKLGLPRPAHTAARITGKVVGVTARTSLKAGTAAATIAVRETANAAGKLAAQPKIRSWTAEGVSFALAHQQSREALKAVVREGLTNRELRALTASILVKLLAENEPASSPEVVLQKAVSRFVNTVLAPSIETERGRIATIYHFKKNEILSHTVTKALSRCMQQLDDDAVWQELANLVCAFIDSPDYRRRSRDGLTGAMLAIACLTGQAKTEDIQEF
jgi:hypothetical protein